MTEWIRPTYTPPTLWDRVVGRSHHDCRYCLDAERFPLLRVLHPPNYPPPPPPPMPKGLGRR